MNSTIRKLVESSLRKDALDENVPLQVRHHIGMRGCGWFVLFSPNGALFSVSTNDGRVMVFCTRTMVVIHDISLFAKCVNGLSWSLDSRYLWACCGLESSIALVDVSHGKVVKRYSFDGTVRIFTIECPPFHSNSCCLRCEKQTLWVTFSRMDADESDADGVCVHTEDISAESSSGKGRSKSVILSTKFRPPKSCSPATSTTPSSFELFCGTNNGQIIVYSLHSDDPIPRFERMHEVIQGGEILGIQFSANGDLMVLNVSAPARSFLALVLVDGMMLFDQFSAPVAQQEWVYCTFSQVPNAYRGDFDSQYVIGATRSLVQMWSVSTRGETASLSLVGRDHISCAAAQPFGELLLLLTYSELYVLGPRREERWSAYEPRFVDVLENTEHEESESEFDEPEPECSAPSTGGEIVGKVESGDDVPIDLFGMPSTIYGAKETVHEIAMAYSGKRGGDVSGEVGVVMIECVDTTTQDVINEGENTHSE
eukprot:TRINITY_DN23344_c0_g2_i1.p1 TRINITY_DN23344_c0_g2~~TRINITY_DN23344_c0_g2_i1.p1  ORF type:complete len:483 (-),score=104.78 TRINITY_DN23344_c0_g2_i1:113-1561(-)